MRVNVGVLLPVHAYPLSLAPEPRTRSTEPDTSRKTPRVWSSKTRGCKPYPDAPYMQYSPTFWLKFHGKCVRKYSVHWSIWDMYAQNKAQHFLAKKTFTKLLLTNPLTCVILEFSKIGYRWYPISSSPKINPVSSKSFRQFLKMISTKILATKNSHSFLCFWISIENPHLSPSKKTRLQTQRIQATGEAHSTQDSTKLTEFPFHVGMLGASVMGG